MPRVSITVPTFNCGRFLGRALHSALGQTYTDYEIIVVDDGSTDDTREILAPFGDKIRYFYQTNEGLSSARNAALAQARGEFIAYLDADDMWYPQRLEVQVAFLDGHKECGFVHSDVTVIDEMDHVIHRRFNAETRRMVPQGYCVLDLLRRCHVQILTVLERRECIERVGGFDGRLKAAQDYFHWIRIAMDEQAIGYIAEPLAMYRRSPNSLSSSPRRMLDDYMLMFEQLLTEPSLLGRHGKDAADIARDRLYAIRRELAYLDRLEGRTSDSLGHTISLVRRWPLRTELYIDLLKSCAEAVLSVRK